MKAKSFKAYLEKRLDKKEITEIELAAQREYEILQLLQKDIAKTVTHYMSKHKVGFNELIKKLGKSPTQISRIIKGEANLTLATVAQLYACMGMKAHLVAK